MPNVLFVCTANICRSPVAEILFAAWLKQQAIPGQWQVASAGTWGVPGQPASGHSQAIAQTLGLDLSQHRSQSVAAALLAAQDVVLGMTRSHVEAIQVEFPALTSRVFLLSQMAGPSYDIADPYGQGRRDYEAMFKELQDLIVRGGPRIVALAESHFAQRQR